MLVTSKKRNPLSPLVISLLAMLGLLPQCSIAIDIAVANRPHTHNDKRFDYSYRLLELALNVTQESYGPYLLKRSDLTMFRDRQFKEIKEGRLLNVMVSPPKPGGTGKALRVKFPIQKGIGSIRLFFVLEDNVDLLSKVETIEDLRQFTIGANDQWSTTVALRNDKFNVVAGESYLYLFQMLQARRFQLFPRGLNEIYTEHKNFKNNIPNLTIDEHIAIVSYLPSYFYVSPTAPRLAERLETGLKILFENGALDAIFNEFYGGVIKKAQLDKRRVLYMTNTSIGPEMLAFDRRFILKELNEIQTNP
ncbi:hypothetical protein SAMN02745866_00010 [Alteromonadaceae bacterium Bs31]|nr:hypothetical protein SAMN02745866_00010 [Alteromonadaceae bacterium Bs31]